MSRRIASTSTNAPSNAPRRCSPGPRPRWRHGLAASGALALAALGLGCTLRDGPGFDPIDVVDPTVTEEEAREIGFEFDRSLQESVRVVDDPVVSGFLNDLGRSILAATPDPVFVYRFRLIDDSTLNAFAVFGGFIYFHTGTVLAAASVDELAGVMGHEIAHVRLNHHGRMQEQAQIPDLLASIGGLAGAIGTGEPGALLAAQGINVALKLRFSREFEAEADREGTRLVAAAGYDPIGISHFFERIMELKRGYPDQVPPYLFSHPDVERRIDAVAVYADGLPSREEDPLTGIDAEFREAQARLEAIVSGERTRWIDAQPSRAPARTDPLLAAARDAEARGEPAAAAALLDRAIAGAPSDPRVRFEAGELALRRAEPATAVGHLREAIRLDPTHSLVFLRLGDAYKKLGEAQLAVFAYEHAARRAGPTGTMRLRADREIEKLSFTVIEESGLADGARDGSTPFGHVVEDFPASARSLAWWARLGPRFADQPDRYTTVWRGPDGREREVPVVSARGGMAGAVLDLSEPLPGVWTVEARLDGDPIDRRGTRVGPEISGR